MTIEEYAMKILTDAGCDIYTYGGEYSEHVLSDLKEAFPDGMEYPYVDVANAVLAVSRHKPIERKPWMMVWDTDSCCDGTACDSLEEAKNLAIDCLVEWGCEEQWDWNDTNPTEEEIEDWDYMIYNCSAWVQKYDPDTDEYEDYWFPSHEELKEIGWIEWEDLKELMKERGLL